MIKLEQIQIRLAEEIRQSNLTQTELAIRLGIRQQTISHYVKGDIMPSLDTFANLCEILNADANFILGIDKK